MVTWTHTHIIMMLKDDNRKNRSITTYYCIVTLGSIPGCSNFLSVLPISHLEYVDQLDEEQLPRGFKTRCLLPPKMCGLRDIFGAKVISRLKKIDRSIAA